MTGLIVAHASIASLMLGLGGYQLLRRVKGDRVHRLAGWIWVLGMLFVASSSFAIRELRHGRLSLLHVLSVVTIVSLALGVWAIRHDNLHGHRASMRGSWFGLVGAFIGAVAVPSRRIPTFVLTDPLGAAGAALGVIVLTFALIALAHVLGRVPFRPTSRRAFGSP